MALVVFDTMIKSAGYKKSENDAVEVNNMIQVMENISIRTKCFVLALDHMGKNEELGARGSSDKPSSFDVYIELKSNGPAARTFLAIKVKGEKGNEQIDFEIVGTTLEDGQKTGFVRWKEWNKSEDVITLLNGNARVLFSCLRDVLARDGELRTLFRTEPDKRCVQKVEVYHEFCNRHKEGKRHDMAFKRSWEELVRAGLVTTKKNDQGLDENERLGVSGEGIGGISSGAHGRKLRAHAAHPLGLGVCVHRVLHLAHAAQTRRVQNKLLLLLGFLAR